MKTKCEQEMPGLQELQHLHARSIADADLAWMTGAPELLLQYQSRAYSSILFDERLGGRLDVDYEGSVAGNHQAIKEVVHRRFRMAAGGASIALRGEHSFVVTYQVSVGSELPPFPISQALRVEFWRKEQGEWRILRDAQEDPADGQVTPAVRQQLWDAHTAHVQAWNEAARTGDAKALKRLVGPDYLGTWHLNPYGQAHSFDAQGVQPVLQAAGEWLHNRKADVYTEHHQILVRRDTEAFLTYHMADERLGTVFCSLDVWRCYNGAWKLVRQYLEPIALFDSIAAEDAIRKHDPTL